MVNKLYGNKGKVYRREGNDDAKAGSGGCVLAWEKAGG